MRFILAALCAASLAAACQTPCPAPPSGPVTAHLTCEDGSNLTVTFTRGPDLARIEEEGYITLTLPARIVGAGYTYAGQGAELRRRGAETTWMRPGGSRTLCTQVQTGASTTTPEQLPRQAMSVGHSSPNCPGSSLAYLRLRTGMSAS